MIPLYGSEIIDWLYDNPKIWEQFVDHFDLKDDFDDDEDYVEVSIHIYEDTVALNYNKVEDTWNFV